VKKAAKSNGKKARRLNNLECVQIIHELYV